MDALLQSLAAQWAGLPAPLREAHGLAAARAEALRALQAAGVPSARVEAWKYTSLRALARRSFAAADLQQAASAIALEPARGPRLVFVDGVYHPAASQVDGLPQGLQLASVGQLLGGDDQRAVNFLSRRFDDEADLFARANAALAVEGPVLRAAAGCVCAQPIELYFIGDAAATARAIHLRGLIELGEGARLSVVEHWLGQSPRDDLATAVLQIDLGRAAQLQHVRLQQESRGHHLFARSEALLAAEAHYRRLDLELGLGLTRHELNIGLNGRGAQVQADGVMLGRDRGHIDCRLGIQHAAAETACSMSWRGLGYAASRVAFHGGILIHPGADGSDAMLSNKNLLLSAQAEVDSQPVLEIHADEVKAAHGATVGRLDGNALFYLRSRGLPIDQAQRLLTAAFCHAVLDGWSSELRDPLAKAVDQALTEAST